MSAPDAAVRMAGVVKHFGGLRPLRVSALSVGPRERVALVGLDAAAAEVFVNMVTGASLPDQGEITVHGRATSAITDADQWVASLDEVGIVSRRAALLEDLTLAANIAMVFTLSLDPVPDDVLASVRQLADEVGLDAGLLHRPLHGADAGVKAQCHLARALALNPRLLVLEHANAVAGDAAAAFADLVVRVSFRRLLPVLALTADETFGRAVATRVYRLDPATGELRARSRWRRWFRRS